ncbi:hypothetical protein ACN27F_11680 [Solwaraspora sp. WMMB335]|uniref:hypothetical protein n=1 Tax=Solwaraspora sp. WMMB335 TaxID=3404118 RepID=UPI003B926A2C
MQIGMARPGTGRRLTLLLAGLALGYLAGRLAGTTRRCGPASGGPTGSGPTGSGPTGSVRSAGAGRTAAAPVWGEAAPVRPAVPPAGQRPGTDLGYHPGRHADDEFAADTVSGASATTPSHPYEVPPGRTTATPAAPVGQPSSPDGRRPRGGVCGGRGDG